MSQAISKHSGYESLNANLSGLGEDLNSVTFANDGGYTLAYGTPGVYPSDPSVVALAAQGLVQAAPSSFNWSNLIGNLVNVGARTGLNIASNITNPAYTTPGAFTRLADGTIITTAGNPVSGYGLPSNINAFGSSFNSSSLLLLGGAALVVLMLMKK